MRYQFLIMLLSIGCCSFIFVQTYDAKYVKTSSYTYKGSTYNLVHMDRGGSDNRIKAKYFAKKGYDGLSVFERYNVWAQDKNLITVFEAGYMDEYGTPVGLTIDNGEVVNRNLAAFDGLVIVFATGGVIATNLTNGDLTLTGGGIDPTRKFDIRNSYTDRSDFISWAQNQEATVFQTHLLVYKDRGTGNVCHVVLNLPEFTTLYDGTVRAKNFLNDIYNLDISFMLNLDPGYQDIFFVYNCDGTLNKTFIGTKPLSRTVSPMCYYYE